MALKGLLSKTNKWLRGLKFGGKEDYQPQLDTEGLLSPQTDGQNQDTREPSEQNEQAEQNSQVLVKKVAPADKSQSLEKLQAGFDNLIDQLKGINEHLNQQVTQHQDLMGRMDKMPQLLESFPSVVENQKHLTEQLIEHLKTTAAKDQQFIEAVEKIPTETAKQTDALSDINNQLAAAADTDVQMAEGFNKFNQSLEKLDESTLGQTDSILQMSKTFSTSDRYLKYLISRQNKRFMWIFMTAIGVCVVVILILAGIILYLRQ